MFEHLVRFGLGLVWLIPVSGSVRLYMQDKKVLAKLSAGDLVALEAKYSAPCLARLRESKRKAKKTGQALDDRRASRSRSWIPLLKSYAWSVL